MNYINEKALEAGYKGVAINQQGVLSNRYKKFIKSKNGLAPFPKDMIYNTKSKRLVDKMTWLVKTGYSKNTLLKKYKDAGMVLFHTKYKNLIMENITVKTIIKQNIGSYDVPPDSIPQGTEVFAWWYNWLKANAPRNKQIRITLSTTIGGEFNYWSGIIGDVIPKSLLTMIQIGQSEGGRLWVIEAGLFNEDYEEATGFEPNVGGTIKMIEYTPIVPVNTKQRYLDGLSYHCVLTPIIKYYTDLQDGVSSVSGKKKYQTILNKLIGNNYKGKGKETKVNNIGFINKYKDGLYLEDLEELVKHLPIEIKIFSPLSLYENTKKPIYSFKAVEYPKKVFKYVNTRNDHLKIIMNDNLEEVVLSKKALYKKWNELQNEDEYYPYRRTRNGTICKIYTTNINYILDCKDQQAIIKALEQDNNLCSNVIWNDDEFSDFVLESVHYNCCVDFKDTKPKITKIVPDKSGIRKYFHQVCLIDDSDDEEDELDTETVQYHIDMKQAYYNFDKNPLYDEEQAFLARCSYYSNNISQAIASSQVGFYRIDNINFSACLNNTKKIFAKLGQVYVNRGVYPHIDLKLLTSLGVKFDVLEGVYGLNMKFKFNEDCLRKFVDGEEVYDNASKLYSNWVGLQNSIATHSCYYIKNNKPFLQTLKADLIQSKSPTTDIFWSKLGEAKIVYKKDKYSHRSHITSYITGYQRTATILQLLEFKVENIIRVVTDGIYFKLDEELEEVVCQTVPQQVLIEQSVIPYNSIGPANINPLDAGIIVDTYEMIDDTLNDLAINIETINLLTEKFNKSGIKLISTFIFDPSVLKLNYAGEDYISYNDVKKNDSLLRSEFIDYEKPQKMVLYAGAGGTGKTTLNIKRYNKFRLGFLAHSNKLCRGVSNEFDKLLKLAAPYHWLILDNYELLGIVLRCNCLLIDEASTITSSMIDKMKRLTPGIPLIFMGDITHQCSPVKDICYTPSIIKSKFDEVITLPRLELGEKVWRFMNCQKQTETCEVVRKMMDDRLTMNDVMNYCINQYGTVSETEFIHKVAYEDVVLSTSHNNKDDLNTKIGNKLDPKWSIIKSGNGYYVGDVVLHDEPKTASSNYEIRYCYTICSIQGETLKDYQNLYIDTRMLLHKRTLYTAISRAKYARQIKFITFNEKVVKNLEYYQNLYKNKLGYKPDDPLEYYEELHKKYDKFPGYTPLRLI
tara:strand:+ start:15160 stop:18717 length:3558 start_codon:yes stop_codon:yes gene_type:complete